MHRNFSVCACPVLENKSREISQNHQGFLFTEVGRYVNAARIWAAEQCSIARVIAFRCVLLMLGLAKRNGSESKSVV